MEKVTFKQRLEESERIGQADNWRKNVPNTGNSQECVWPVLRNIRTLELEAKLVREGGVA